MPPINPYAAPQTLEPQLDPASLPLAELHQPAGQRQRFPEKSTAQLQRLIDQSMPLEAMLIVWLLTWFATVGLVGAYFLQSREIAVTQYLGWSLMAVVTCRLLCSFHRTKPGRWYMFACDALLSGAALVGIGAGFYTSAQPLEQLFPLLVMALCLLTVAVLAYRSCRTLLQARELFQPVCLQHDDLVRELAYRKEHRVE